MKSESANMYLIVEDRIYELYEISSPVYAVYDINITPSYLQSGEPDDTFDNYYYPVINTTEYKASRINNKFYAHKLIGVMPTTLETQPKGLYFKYFIERADGSPIDPTDEYFVLKLSGKGDQHHIDACQAAIRTYAAAIKPFLPELAQDLEIKYGNL